MSLLLHYESKYKSNQIHVKGTIFVWCNINPSYSQKVICFFLYEGSPWGSMGSVRKKILYRLLHSLGWADGFADTSKLYDQLSPLQFYVQSVQINWKVHIFLELTIHQKYMNYPSLHNTIIQHRKNTFLMKFSKLNDIFYYFF